MKQHRLIDRLMPRSAGRHRDHRPRLRRLWLEVLEDRTLLASFTVTNPNGDTGPGTLFDAIAHDDSEGEASDPNPFVIDFNLPGAGLHTIALTVPLPVITHPVIIDGTSQPGYLPGSGTTLGQPVIELDGSQAGQTNGLELETGNSVIEGLIINNFAFSGIFVSGYDGLFTVGQTVIEGNFIGTDATGSVAKGNGGNTRVAAIAIVDSSDDTIGGPTAAQGNLISGNDADGIDILDGTSTGNIVEGNFIGTNVNGTTALGNVSNGIAFGQMISPFIGVGFASDNVVGGTDPGDRNIISGNAGSGVLIEVGAANQVEGNTIGLDVNGTAAVPNGQDGVHIEDGKGNVIGGTDDGAGNVISANVLNGVEIDAGVTVDGTTIAPADQSATTNIIEGNDIGTDITGTFTNLDGKPDDGLGNHQNGIVLVNASNDPSVVVQANVIGGADAADGTVDGVDKARNIISGNLANGIVMSGPNVQLNFVEGNNIGTDKNGTSALGNQNAGIFLSSDASGDGPSQNQIGGTDALAGNLVSGNGQPATTGGTPGNGDGIVLFASDKNIVLGNLIGTDESGDRGLPNTSNGVVVDGSQSNTIGGTTNAAGNIISGNFVGDGVLIRGGGAEHNVVESNVIGLSWSGSKLGNLNGVVIVATSTGAPSDNTIGGTVAGPSGDIGVGNVISANTLDGVQLSSGTNAVAGNFIGTDATGTVALGNGAIGGTGDGVEITDSSGNTIGGSTAAAHNVIAANANDGVLISGADASGNIVSGNIVGIGTDGSHLGNQGDGILITDSPSNTIGGNLGGNTISANTGAGVHIQGQDAKSNTVDGNKVGTDLTGKQAAGNMDGVLIEGGASSSVIQEDVISGNNGNGVNLNGATGTTLLSNDIGTNAGASVALPNLANGISLTNSPGTIIGEGGLDPSNGGKPNVISGNKLTGILVLGAKTTGTMIQGNYIGITGGGDETVLGNGLAGVAIVADPDGTGPINSTITGDVIGGNVVDGIRLSGVTGTKITGNFIGSDPTDLDDDLGNVDSGIVVSNAPGNTIGGTTEGDGNTIKFTTLASIADSDYGTGNGIVIAGSGSTTNFVEGNLISQNSQEGIVIAEGASSNSIGSYAGFPLSGPAVPTSAGNFIINNGQDGVEIIDAGTIKNAVLGNLIGIDKNGLAAGNKGDGVVIDNGAASNLIGAVVTGFGNYIAASTFKGIFIGEGAHDNSVLSNDIGTNLQGAFQSGYGNVQFGIDISSAPRNTVGGAVAQASAAPGNLIVGNGVGIAISGADSQGNSVLGNVIAQSQGFSSGGAQSPGDGMVLDSGASNNQIGGPDQADSNRIFLNKAAGVFLASGTGDSVRRNLIYQNSGLGIDLAPAGPNPNQPRETSGSGPNNLQNTPVLNFATVGANAGNGGAVAGTMEGLGTTTYTIDVFAGTISQNAGGSEADDAETFVVSLTVTTNASGIALFDFPLPDGSVQAGTILRATATDSSGDTSEFSDPLEVQTDSDGDGIPDVDENVNGGDANQDGTPDSQQSNVVTVPDALNQNSFVTFVAPKGVSFEAMRPAENPSPDDAPVATQFGLGFFDFRLNGILPGQHVAVQMILPVMVGSPTAYWRYGATPSNLSPHWFDWLYDPSTDTGAQISGNTITLHFVDGARGDDDLTANGLIVDAGGPGFASPFTVTDTNDSGAGSLRQAILNANANLGMDEITFDIAGTGQPTIDLLSPLPAITDPVTIDGLALPPSEADDQGTDGTTPLVELDGSHAGPGAVGLTLDAGNSTIQGLFIEHFSGDGILIDASAGSSSDDDDDDEESYATETLSSLVIEHNGGFGVEIDDTAENTIRRAVISGNAQGGVDIHGSDAFANELLQDLIGTQAEGTSPLGNSGPGVLLTDGANANEIGFRDPNFGNTIAFNVGAGVQADAGTDNLIEANSIYANGGLGIDLGGTGVTSNDPDDSDGVQNFPVITSVASYGGFIYLIGTLTSMPSTSLRLEFYASDSADPSGFGEGKTYLGSAVVETDSTGAGSFDLSFEQKVAPGSFITATASANGTSEFSAAVLVPMSQVLVFTINTNDDVSDAVPDPAHFSLREAIIAANAHPGQDIIRFDLADAQHVITPLSPMPDITDPVIIDGESQPGYQGLPLVELDGSQAGAAADGLVVTGGGTTIRGLVINQFQGSWSSSGDDLGGNAIVLEGTGGNLIEGDYLGTDFTGTTALPNGQAGVYVDNSPSNTIGGTTAAARNVIVTVFLSGQDATGNVVEGNDIDVDVTGTALLSGTIGFVGQPSGLVINEGPDNTIGGTATGAGNVIGGGLNLVSGDGNVVVGNIVGLNAAGTAHLAGGEGTGITIDSNDNAIGGSTTAAHNIIVGGIHIGDSASENQVEGNFIGTDITGTFVVETGAVVAGVLIQGNSNTIGGDAPGAGNLIAGCYAGVDILAGADYNVVEGNTIGPDVTGTEAPGNENILALSNQYGVLLAGSFNTIGGLTAGARNLISGNGIGIGSSRDTGDVIEGNFIGTDITGTRALANIAFGVDLHTGSGDLIGGILPGSGNVISGNGQTGFVLGASMVVWGNFIGTDWSGAQPLGNGGDGISTSFTGDLIGGAVVGSGNVISANGGNGVSITVQTIGDAPGNIVQGNKIGTDASGAEDLGNAGNGLYILGSTYLPGNQTIGGTVAGAGNTIAFNGGLGVDSAAGPGDSIRDNDIFANGGPGIAADINSVLSTYAEARGLAVPENAPSLTSAVFNLPGTVITGTLTGTPLTLYEIDFFASDAVDPSGFGEGKTYLESISVLVDASGSVAFQIPMDDAIPVGQWITATATDSAGNTSGFSQAIPVVAAASPDAVQFSAPAYLVTETGGAAVVVVNRLGSMTGRATVDYTTVDGSARAGTNYTAESGTLTFADGQASQTVTIPIQDDGIATPDESFQIVLSNPTGIGLGSMTDAVATIADAESAGVLSFSTGAVRTLESEIPAPLVVTRTGGSTGLVTVDYRITGGTAIPDVGNVVVPGAEYVDTYGTLTFEDGQTTATIPISILDPYLSASLPNAPAFGDALTIVFTLGNPTGGAALGAISTSVLTIHGEDDAQGGFGIEKITGTQYGSFVQVTVQRTGNVAGLESIQYATSDGTGQAGVNYTAVSGTLTFQPGEQETSVDVSIFSTLPDGTPATFLFTISDPTGGAVLDEGEDQITVAFSTSPAAFSVFFGVGNQGDSTATVTVERTGGTLPAATVDYDTSDGTALANVDYVPVSGTLFFPAGATTGTFTVPLLPDGQLEGDVNFLVNLSNPTAGTVAETPGIVTIASTPGSLQISSDSYTVAENDATLSIVVMLDRLLAPNNFTGTVSVDYATSDGTADAGSDYGAVSGTLTFPADFSQKTATITIPIFDNSLLEGDKTFFLTLSDLVGGTSLVGGGTAMVTILDNNSNSPPDTTPPDITGAPDRPANAAGWYNAPVTITFTATDDQSGVSNVTIPITLSGEGANQSATGTATDNAFNSASTTVSGIKIDVTKPTTTASVAPINGSATGNQTVTLIAVDNLSGIEQIFYEVDGGKPQIYSGPFSLASDAGHTVAFWSVDKAGNVEEAQSITVAKSVTGGTGTGGAPPSQSGTPESSPPIVVSLKRYGIHMHPTVLVLTFSGALDSTRAENVKNYRIVGPAGRQVHIVSAIYDPTDDTVTLRPKERISIHHTYRLKVVGTGTVGVMGDDGILLDGAENGLAGSDYMVNLTWKNLVLSPAEARKYAHPSQPARPAGALAHRFIGDSTSHLLRRTSTKYGSQRTPI